MARPILHPDPDIAGAGLRALAAAVIVQAADDAQAGDPDALAWLLSDAPLWAEGIGVQIEDWVQGWIARGMKRRKIKRHTSDQANPNRAKQRNRHAAAVGA